MYNFCFINMLKSFLFIWMLYSLSAFFYSPYIEKANFNFNNHKDFFFTIIACKLTILNYYLESPYLFHFNIISNIFVTLIFWSLYFLDQDSIIDPNLYNAMIQEGNFLIIQFGLHVIPLIFSIVQWIHFPFIHTLKLKIVISILIPVYLSTTKIIGILYYDGCFPYTFINNFTVAEFWCFTLITYFLVIGCIELVSRFN